MKVLFACVVATLCVSCSDGSNPIAPASSVTTAAAQAITVQVDCRGDCVVPPAPGRGDGGGGGAPGPCENCGCDPEGTGCDVGGDAVAKVKK